MGLGSGEVPAKGVVALEKMAGDTEEDTALLQPMAVQARRFLSSFAWCKGIRAAYFGDGIGGVVAVFLFHIEPAGPRSDEWLWVVVGDVPPAYLVLGEAKTPSAALEMYVEEMALWVALAKQGRESADVIPVDMAATEENARQLEAKLKFLTQLAIPGFREAEAVRA